MARDSNERQHRKTRDFHHPAMTYQPPRQLKRFRAAMALVVSALLVGGTWTGLWFAAATYVRSGIEDMVKSQAAQANAVSYADAALSGFPSRIVLTYAQPSYLGVVAGKTVSWKADTLVLSTRPWLPWRLHAEAPGHHVLSTSDGALSLSGDVADLGVDFVAGGGWPERLGVDVRGLDLHGSADVVIEALSLALDYNDAVKASGESVKVSLSGANWTLPLNGGYGMGDTVQSLDVALKVTGPVKPGPLYPILTQWRDVGGAVQVENLKLRLGPLAVATAGTLALDGEMQPVGAFSAKFEGLFQVLEILRAEGVLNDGNAVVATMALAAMSTRPADGSPPFINLAVSVQDRKVTLGTIALMELPKVNWGGEAEKAKQAPQEPERDYKDAPQVY